MDFKIDGNAIRLNELPKKTKKLTATRFAAVLGLNRWSTPFQIWCQVTKLYEPPFEDTIYTKAGKVIEPKICEYLRKRYFMDIKSPTDVYGEDYFKKTWGDFFGDTAILGGMWDFIGDDFVVEVKTTKRAEDWKEDIPPYYKLQAALYAHLLGFDDVVVTVSFLEDKDYAAPEDFKPTVQNTKLYRFKMSETYPTFHDDYVQPALDWWQKHVVTGVSPAFDEKVDAEYLKGLRTATAVTDADLEALITKGEKLLIAVNKAEAKIADKKDELKKVEAEIKKRMVAQFGENDTKVELSGKKFMYTVSKTVKRTLNDALVVDYLESCGEYIEDYMKESETMTLRKKEIKEEEA